MGAAPVIQAARERAPAPARRAEAHFIHGPVRDVLLALAWVPFVVVIRYLAESGMTQALAVGITATFLLSFLHQPLTVALVYGDKENFRLRKAIFTWSPLIFVVATIVTYNVNFLLLAIIAGLWNAQHTLMQRYGITRIYGRKVGQDDGLVEKLLLWSWLILALVWTAANPDTPAKIARVELGSTNEDALDVMVDLAPVAQVLLWPAAAATVVLAAVWLVQEARRPVVNPVKWLYVGATAALFGVVLVDPLAGILGYVGAHALEYFVIVHQSLGKRYTSAEDDGGALLGRAVRARTGRLGFIAIYALCMLALIVAVSLTGSVLLYFVVYFTLGGMHVFYDAFIWKLRRPAVARSLAISARAPAT
jgi:hypothetical protein